MRTQYRIRETTLNNGNRIYYAQKRKYFFFWGAIPDFEFSTKKDWSSVLPSEPRTFNNLQHLKQRLENYIQTVNGNKEKETITVSFL